jgi:dienelactone hydrolase
VPAAGSLADVEGGHRAPERRRGRRCLAAVAIAVTGAVACSPGGPGPTAAPGTVTTGGATAPTGAPARTYAVGTRVETWVDTSRPTPANGDFGGSPSRTLRVRFWYPAEGARTADPRDGAPAARHGAPFPLLVFSHGFTGTPEAYAALAAEVARHGYVVAAPRYPLSSRDAPGGPTIADLANQPADASFVIDRTIAAGRSGPGWLAGLVDAHRVAAGGHSLGAMTTYGLTYNGCCRDPRVDAAVVLAGFAGGFEGAWFEGPAVPLLAIHGDADRTVAYELGVRAFESAKPPKFLVTILGGDHSADMHGGDAPGQRLVERAIVDFLDAYLRDDPGALARLRAVADRPGLASLRAEDASRPRP